MNVVNHYGENFKEKIFTSNTQVCILCFVDQSRKLSVRKTVGFYVQETSLFKEAREWGKVLELGTIPNSSGNELTVTLNILNIFTSWFYKCFA